MAMMITIDQLDGTQKLSVERALEATRRIVATTGPAGSGKTTIMRLVYDALKEAGFNPVICAPTGKAARRVREATGRPAQTIHMLLQYTRPMEINEKTGKPYGDTYPRRNREFPIDHDAVLCDEYAMVPHGLHRNLIDALPRGGRLIAYGDLSQLPPIEKSQAIAAKQTPFGAMLEKFDGIVLDRIHRQAEDSGILDCLQRILGGTAPRDNKDFKRIITDLPVDALIEQLDAADYRLLENQILTPANVSWIGTAKLNATLQTMLMPEQRETLRLPRNKWDKNDLRIGVGDKVIMTKNWYDLECSDNSIGVFNGEIGTVTEISDVEEVVVDFGDRICRIPPAFQIVYKDMVTIGYPQQDLYLAYAITTHKAQGSEYKNVIYVINKSLIKMLNRKNMYTALSRAREKATLIADMKGLSMSITMKEPKVFGE